MSRVSNIEDLKSVLIERWSQLEDVRDYLNDAGKAKLGALKAVYFYASFHDDLESLIEDEDYKNLFLESDKHPEYYRTLKSINFGINNALK